MVDIGLVQGDKESAIPVQVCNDTVYIRLNIEKISTIYDDEEFTEYQWHEYQYTLAEWIAILTDLVVDTSKLPQITTRTRKDSTRRLQGVNNGNL